MSQTISKGLLRATGRTVAWTVVTTAANAGLAVVTARQLGARGRGELVLLITVASRTCLVASLGTNTAARYFLVRPEHAVGLGAYLRLSVMLVVTEAGIAVVAGALTLRQAGVSASLPKLAILGLFAAVLLASYQLQDALNAYGWTATTAAIAAMGALLSLVLTLLLAALGISQAEAFLAPPAIGVAAQAATALALLSRRRPRSDSHAVRHAWTALIRKGLPALGLNASQSLTFRLDRYIIGMLLGAGPVGIYSVAATASEAFRVLPAAFGQVAFHRTASRRLSPDDFARPRRCLLIAMSLVLLLMAVAAPWVVQLVFGPEFDGAVQPLRILLLGELAIMSFHIDTRILGGLGRIRDGGLAGVAGLVVVVVLDCVLIPAHGLTGAAWASVIAYFVMGVYARLSLRRNARSQMSGLPKEVR